MILIQTAFAQETSAVLASFSPEPTKSDGYKKKTLAVPDISCLAKLWPGHIAGSRCGLIETGIGSSVARKTLTQVLDRLERPSLVLSVGFAGALSSRLRVGDRCLVTRVLSEAEREPVPLIPTLNRLQTTWLDAAYSSTLVTVAKPVLTASAKALLAERTSAELCDMETHAVAAACVARNLPWLSARVVSDEASESLSPWILSLPELIKRRRWWHVARMLASHPQDLPGLIRLAMRVSNLLQRELSQFTAELISNVVEA